MKFYGRKTELGIIKNWITALDRGTLFTAIIGRRRIGKTRLWLESIKGVQNSLYFFCQPGQLKKTFEQVDDQLHELGFTSVPQDLTSFFKACEILLSQKKPLILFFDEVQNLFLTNTDNLSIFQQFIDDFKRKGFPCLVVFCGSVRSLMHRILFEESSPLYGRLDHRIQLNPLSFNQIKRIYKDNSITAPDHQLRLYTMFGSNIRFYEILLQFDLFQHPIEDILEKGWVGFTGLFSDELNKILVPELKKSSYVYTGILSAIARGIQSVNEIASLAEITTTSLGNYLPFLIDTLDLVDKEVSVTEKSNSKISRYVIKDPFIYFWYRYIEKNRSLLEMGQTKTVVKRIMEDLPNLEGAILEMIFRQKILENPPIEFDVAGSVFKNRNQIEVDFLLANQRENKIHAFEIKRGKTDKKAVLNKLIYNTARLDFKSIKLKNPQIEGTVYTLNDL